MVEVLGSFSVLEQIARGNVLQQRERERERKREREEKFKQRNILGRFFTKLISIRYMYMHNI